MTEAELRAEVIKLALELGALVHHCRDSRYCEGSKGLPDLIIAGPGGVIFAELKSKHGEVDADQQNWEFTLTTTSVYYPKEKIAHVYYLWRPEDLESGTIEKLIRQVALA